MKLRHLVPFAILLAWQGAPVRVDTIPRSRFSLSLAYGLAQLEDYTPPQFDCNGGQVSPERSEQVQVSSVGTRADFITSGGLRVTAFGGSRSSARADVAGSYGGFQLAAEGRSVGFGAGITAGVSSAVLSGPGARDAVNLFLRLGNRDGTNFQAEYLPASEAAGMVGYVRVGVGFNQGLRGGTGGFAGVSFSPYGSLMAFADVAVPASARLDWLLHGQLGPGHIYQPWGLALGARFNLLR